LKIIDCRVRPPLRGYLSMTWYRDTARRDRFMSQLGFRPPASVSGQSITELLKEMAAAGVVRAIMTGRFSQTFGSVSNEDLIAITKEYPNHFLGVASVDPTDRTRAIQQIQHAVAAGLKAVTIEPGSYPTPMYADDRRLYPIYAHCDEMSIPVFIMNGGNAGPDLSYSSPIPLDRVLAEFPHLKVVVTHGGWPWVNEILHLAFRRPNLFVSPDMYLVNMPGMDDYIRAANGFLADRFLYASSYPLCPVKDYADWFLALPIKPASMEKVVFRNAVELLDLRV